MDRRRGRGVGGGAVVEAVAAALRAVNTRTRATDIVVVVDL